ncbi:transposase [Blautia marasmi]|uniref:transposase n=1 Tax=Blautia marasmi TaxID=1917868 RepID=UPI002592567E|nr:transposase [uncultured Blautia sp.]
MAKGKYEEWLEPEGLLKLQGWARDGLIDEQIAENMGIVPSTLYEWKKKYPNISEALKKGKEVVDRQVENALLKRALGYEYEEKKTEQWEDAEGNPCEKITVTRKQIAPDTTAQIFWLKNRKSDVWRDKHEVNSNSGEKAVEKYIRAIEEDMRK